MFEFNYKFDSQKKLTEYLIKTDALKTSAIIDAFNKIDRKNFVDLSLINRAHENNALPIGYGQTISQPTTVSIMLEQLQPQKGQSILDIGSGSGWTTALLSEIVGKKGHVIGLELISDLVKFGQQNINKYDFPQTKIIKANQQIGLPNQQFDRILVSATSEILPYELLDQIKPGGIMVIPIQHSIIVVSKDTNNQITKKEIPGFVFVPLITPNN